jgi:hypothetical protein
VEPKVASADAPPAKKGNAEGEGSRDPGVPEVEKNQEVPPVEKDVSRGELERPDVEMDLNRDRTPQEPPTQTKNAEGQPPESSSEEREGGRAGSPPAQTQNAQEQPSESSPDRVESVEGPEVRPAERDALMGEPQSPNKEMHLGEDDKSQQPPAEKENAESQLPESSFDLEVPRVEMYAPSSEIEEPDAEMDLGEDDAMDPQEPPSPVTPLASDEENDGKYGYL